MNDFLFHLLLVAIPVVLILGTTSTRNEGDNYFVYEPEKEDSE